MQVPTPEVAPVIGPRVLAPSRSTPGWIRLLDADFSRPWPAALLAVAYLVSHLPWLGMGYGADPDAWRVAMSARYLMDHASYLPSRLPGYPVHDIAMVALIRGGWSLTNSSTLMVSLVGVYVFSVLVRRLALPMGGLLTVTFAFLPFLWSTSTTTLDYSWALTFLLGAYLAETSDRPLVAGALLGLAGGCRISYLAFALPLGLLFWQGQRRSRLQQFLVSTGITWLAVFSPVWVRYGTQFWKFYDVRPEWGDLLHALSVTSIGLLPLLVLSGCLLLSLPALGRLGGSLRKDAHAAAWAMVVLLAFFVFVRLPLQTYYLIPAAPFALLLLSRVLRPSLMLVAGTALVLSGFVDIYTIADAGWRSPSALLGVRPTPGLVLQDYRLRRERMELVRRVPDLGLPPHSVLTAGFYFPMVAELYHTQLGLTLPEGYLNEVGPLTDNAQLRGARDIVYVWLLTQGDARNLLRAGYAIYSLDFSRETSTPTAIRIYHPENEHFGIH